MASCRMEVDVTACLDIRTRFNYLYTYDCFNVSHQIFGDPCQSVIGMLLSRTLRVVAALRCAPHTGALATTRPSSRLLQHTGLRRVHTSGAVTMASTAGSSSSDQEKEKGGPLRGLKVLEM